MDQECSHLHHSIQRLLKEVLCLEQAGTVFRLRSSLMVSCALLLLVLGKALWHRIPLPQARCLVCLVKCHGVANIKAVQ